MTRFKKSFTILLLCAMLAALLCPGVLATRSVETATANYRGIRILVNGAQVNPCDAEGNAVEPFIIGGTTYLPVRAVAGALGLEVGWEAATSTVTLRQGGETNYGEGEPLASSGEKTGPLDPKGFQGCADAQRVRAFGEVTLRGLTCPALCGGSGGKVWSQFSGFSSLVPPI